MLRYFDAIEEEDHDAEELVCEFASKVRHQAARLQELDCPLFGSERCERQRAFAQGYARPLAASMSKKWHCL